MMDEDALMTGPVFSQSGSRIRVFPLTYFHLVSNSGQCDACIMKKNSWPTQLTWYDYAEGVTGILKP